MPENTSPNSDLLSSLIAHTKKGIPIYQKADDEAIFNFNYEEAKLYANISLKNLSRIHNIIEHDSDYQTATSLFEDIKLSTSTDIILERIFYNIRYRLFSHMGCHTDNLFCIQLFTAMRNSFIWQNQLENEIRVLFTKLIKAHLESSKETSIEYQQYLKELQLKIAFKYPLVIKTTILKELPSFNDLHYNTQNFIGTYLDTLITNLLTEILKFSDEELELDSNYAIAIAYQTLLRVALILLDNQQQMIYYDNIYNSVETPHYVAKDIIRTAFISNEHDIETIKLKEKRKHYE